MSMTGALGFNDPFHDSSYARLDDAGLLHVELERFTRQKLERQSPLLGFLDRMPGDALDGVAAIGVTEGETLAPMFWHLAMAKSAGAAAEPLVEHMLARLTAAQDLVFDVKQGGFTHLGPLDRFRDPLLAFLGHALRLDVRVAVLGHHHCHTANAFLSSPYTEALSVSLDGGGIDYASRDGAPEQIYGAAYRCTAEPFRMTRLPFAPDVTVAGAFARVGTRVLDLQFGEEGTIMAMAAYGDPARFASAMAPGWMWSPNQVVAWDQPGAAALTAQLNGLRDQVRTEQDRFDVAAALQHWAGDHLRAQLTPLVTPGTRALCLSGGLALNCQLVGQVQGWFPWLAHVYVPPAPYDGGLSIGVAQVLRHGRMGVPAPRPAYMPFASGPGATPAGIMAACYPRQPVPATPADVAGRLAAGQIGGRFAGGAESGRRALGHRSILADPRQAAARTRINTAIKHRAWFRPLAPMILAEHVAEWFDCPPGFESPSMSHALRVRDGMGEYIPAVIHRDGTARVQTVHAALTPGLHALLSAFFELTGVPALLNTSFNDQEPIVQTPAEAVDCFDRTGLDFLYFADPGLLLAR